MAGPVRMEDLPVSRCGDTCWLDCQPLPMFHIIGLPGRRRADRLFRRAFGTAPRSPCWSSPSIYSRTPNWRRRYIRPLWIGSADSKPDFTPKERPLVDDVIGRWDEL